MQKSPTFPGMNLLRGLMLIALSVIGLRAAAPVDPLLGRWALSLPGDRAGWLEVRRDAGWFDGSILWGGGSVVPLSSVAIVDGALTVTRVREVPRKDPAGKVVRTQQSTETISGRLEGDPGFELGRADEYSEVVEPRLSHRRQFASDSRDLRRFSGLLQMVEPAGR